jgi:hypothetical protein
MKQKTTVYIDKKIYEDFKAFAKQQRRTVTASLELAMEHAMGRTKNGKEKILGEPK